MAVAIRLARHGAKKRPYYWIVAADKRAPRDGRFLEKLGTYNPLLPKDHENRVTLNEERVRYWLSVGAQPTDRVSRFLEARGILEPKTRHNPKKGQPHAKALERMKEKAQAAAAASEASSEPVSESEGEAAEA